MNENAFVFFFPLLCFLTTRILNFFNTRDGFYLSELLPCFFFCIIKVNNHDVGGDDTDHPLLDDRTEAGRLYFSLKYDDKKWVPLNL